MTLACLLWFNQGMAKELILATSKSIPPYIIEETESGVQLDRVKAVFEHAGHHIKKVIFTSNKRSELLLQQKKVDAIINAPINQSTIFYSEPVIRYQNVAITLTSSGFTLNHIEDLRHYRVMAFQNASKFLGPIYSDMVKQNPTYYEAINQQAQLERLYLKQVDVIILEHRIFEYFNQLYLEAGHYSSPVSYHYIFPSAPRSVGFHDEHLRDQFNLSLHELFKSESTASPAEARSSNSPSTKPPSTKPNGSKTNSSKTITPGHN